MHPQSGDPTRNVSRRWPIINQPNTQPFRGEQSIPRDTRFWQTRLRALVLGQRAVICRGSHSTRKPSNAKEISVSGVGFELQARSRQRERSRKVAQLLKIGSLVA
ncbi:LOW QUALITY PROTEIN: hypothetical protein RSAG8_03286, partial [Rhizoctonia solani AG-8 WAC10335]